MADLSQQQIEALKKAFEAEAKKSKSIKAKVDVAIKKGEALQAAAKKMGKELAQEAD